MSGMRVIVDRERCESHGQCVIVAPEVFTGFDDRGELEYVAEPASGQRAAIAEAIAICPAAAIRVEDDSR